LDDRERAAVQIRLSRLETSQEDRTMTRYLARVGLAALAATATLSFIAPAFADGVERSRGQLIEVGIFAHNQIFKHDAMLNRVDTDTYGGGLRFPAFRSSGRVYILGDQIVRVGNSNDNLTTFATIAKPEGTIPLGLMGCGSRACVVLAPDGCQGDFVIGSFGEGDPTPVFSGAFPVDQHCVRDAIEQGGDLFVWLQRGGVTPGERRVFLRRFNQNLTLISELQGPILDFVGERMAPHRTDPSSVFVLDTNSSTFNKILRMELSTGDIVAESPVHEGDLTSATRDITHFQASNEVIMLKINLNLRTYTLTGFNDATLAVTRERTFSY
jgi:hypothetical protein